MSLLYVFDGYFGDDPWKKPGKLQNYKGVWLCGLGKLTDSRDDYVMQA